jgi:hypothetical protein
MSSSPLASGLRDLMARSFRALSTTATVIVSARAERAQRILRDEVEAIYRLRRFDQAVRLLRLDGEVFTLGGWSGSEQA